MDMWLRKAQFLRSVDCDQDRFADFEIIKHRGDAVGP